MYQHYKPAYSSSRTNFHEQFQWVKRSTGYVLIFFSVFSWQDRIISIALVLYMWEEKCRQCLCRNQQSTDTMVSVCLYQKGYRGSREGRMKGLMRSTGLLTCEERFKKPTNLFPYRSCRDDRGNLWLRAIYSQLAWGRWPGSKFCSLTTRVQSHPMKQRGSRFEN